MIHLYEVLSVVKFMESVGRVVVAKTGEGNGELLCRGHRVVVMLNEKSSRDE